MYLPDSRKIILLSSNDDRFQSAPTIYIGPKEVLSRPTLLTAYVRTDTILTPRTIPPHLRAEISLPGCGSGFAVSPKYVCSTAGSLTWQRSRKLTLPRAHRELQQGGHLYLGNHDFSLWLVLIRICKEVKFLIEKPPVAL